MPAGTASGNDDESGEEEHKESESASEREVGTDPAPAKRQRPRQRAPPARTKSQLAMPPPILAAFATPSPSKRQESIEDISDVASTAPSDGNSLDEVESVLDSEDVEPNIQGDGHNVYVFWKGELVISKILQGGKGNRLGRTINPATKVVADLYKDPATRDAGIRLAKHPRKVAASQRCVLDQLTIRDDDPELNANLEVLSEPCLEPGSVLQWPVRSMMCLVNRRLRRETAATANAETLFDITAFWLARALVGFRPLHARLCDIGVKFSVMVDKSRKVLIVDFIVTSLHQGKQEHQRLLSFVEGLVSEMSTVDRIELPTDTASAMFACLVLFRGLLAFLSSRILDDSDYDDMGKMFGVDVKDTLSPEAAASRAIDNCDYHAARKSTIVWAKEFMVKYGEKLAELDEWLVALQGQLSTLGLNEQTGTADDAGLPSGPSIAETIDLWWKVCGEVGKAYATITPLEDNIG